ncbi:hypothetical protein DY000_02024828 [Brassica cretica]|uniref:Uncharacterized protein n=1 Tax=Brassica cretica TaxID=69181 RepID=A0ABQ7E215_BRACR|nr:hypothetical protein DY000_02024828 [Brassica cretica]
MEGRDSETNPMFQDVSMKLSTQINVVMVSGDAEQVNQRRSIVRLVAVIEQLNGSV